MLGYFLAKSEDHYLLYVTHNCSNVFVVPLASSPAITTITSFKTHPLLIEVKILFTSIIQLYNYTYSIPLVTTFDRQPMFLSSGYERFIYRITMVS